MSRNKRKAKAPRKDFESGQGQVDTEKARPVVKFRPLNGKQTDYEYDLRNGTVILGIGPAGSGKSYCAATIAAQDLAERRIRRIVLSRPNVPTGKSLGAFPGSVEEKMEPWLHALTNTLKQHLGVSFYEQAVKTGAIQIQPIETIRGQSFDDAILLFDESQQLEVDEIQAIVTRVGRNSRLVLMGDVTQRDNTGGGLEYITDLATRHHLPVKIHQFVSDDIVRSDTCRLFVKAFEKDAEANEQG